MSAAPQRVRRQHAAWLLILSLFGIPSHAQSDEPRGCSISLPGGSTCGGEGVTSQGNDSGTDMGAGNPINVVTGNKFQREVDLPALPGVLGLEIVRYYNSVASGEADAPGIFGRGWRLSYDTALIADGDTLQLLQADGSPIRFRLSLLQIDRFIGPRPEQGQILRRKSARGTQYTWLWTSGRRLDFDAQGRLVQIAVPGGEFVTLRRDRRGQLRSVTDPQGRQLTLHYPEHGETRDGQRFAGIQTIDSPVGRFTYTYGDPLADSAMVRPTAGLARLRSVAPPSAPGSPLSTRHYHYENPQQPTLLTGISLRQSDLQGRVTERRLATYGYDADGIGILSDHAQGGPTGGSRIVLSHPRSDLTLLTDRDGTQTLYRHTQIRNQYRLAEVLGAGCESCGPSNVRYEYDAQGRLTGTISLKPVTVHDARPQTPPVPTQKIATRYDPLGRVVSVMRIDYRDGKTQPPRLLVRYGYGGGDLLSSVRLSGLKTADLRWNRPVLIARPSVVPGREYRIHIAYNAAGQPLSVTEDGYSPLDKQGRPGTTPTAITRSSLYRYTEINGRSLLTETDGPLPNGRIGDATDSDLTRYRYDRFGNRLDAIVHPLARTSALQYDHAGRIQSRTAAFEGITQRMTRSLDPQGRLMRTTGPDQTQTRLHYDIAGALQSITLPDGRTLQIVPTHDAASGTPAATASDTLTTAYGQPGTITQHQVLRLEANGKTAERQFDDFGRVVALRNPGQAWQTADYDAANRLIRLHDPRGARAEAQYDLANRLKTLQRFTPSADAPESTTTLGWQGFRKTTEAITDADGTRTTAYTYTPEGWLERQTLNVSPAAPISAAAVAFTQVSAYDAHGRRASFTLPSGQRLHYGYDGNGRLISMKADTKIRWLRWLVDRLPQRWQPTVELLESAYPSFQPPFAPSLSQGRLPHPSAGENPNAPEPGLSANAPGANFDPAGYPQQIDTPKGRLRLNWNAAGQLARVSASDGQLVARYAYDAQGRRVSKTTAEGTAYFVYDGTRLIATADQQGTISDEYVHHGLRPVAWLRSDPATPWHRLATLYRLQTDHRGALLAVQDEQHRMLWLAQLDAWGQLREKTINTLDPRLRLVAQYADQETGLSYHLARYYDPAAGRFISPDPAGVIDSLSNPDPLQLDMTAYAGGNPFFYVDPDGAAKLTYILIDAFGGDPLNAMRLTIKSGVDLRMMHFAFYMTDIAGASGEQLIYDPNGTFHGLNQNGAIAWNSSQPGAPNPWASFQQHYASSMITGTWATIDSYDDTEATALYEALTGINPIRTQPSTSCGNIHALVELLPDLPRGFYTFDHYVFPSYIHLLPKPIFFADQMPNPDDPRYIDLNVIPWGRITFDTEGNDSPSSLFFSRQPHLPKDNGQVIGSSGITIGRGYDLGKRASDPVQSILTRGNLALNSINVLIGAVGQQGNAAMPYFQNTAQPANILLTREQQYLIFLQTYNEEYEAAKRIYNNNFKITGWPTWEALDPIIRDVIVDMKFRGDFKQLSVNNSTAHPALATAFRDAVMNNDRTALCKAFKANENDWRSDTGPWNVPDDRFLRRIEYLGYTGTLKKGQCP